MRTSVIAGNWKMNLDRGQAVALAAALRDRCGAATGVEVGVAPPFPYLEAVASVLDGSSLWVAGQDMHWESSGAFTGDVAGPMLGDVGCSHVILGHSERRHGCHETPEIVGRKVRAALAVGLVPIVCVGELLDEREAGRTREVVVGQIEAALVDLGEADLASMILAYEPVWAIGTGLAATAEQANDAIAFIRGIVADVLGDDIAGATRIQYGGSVKPDNAAELFAQPDIDGALVGGASLDAEAFLAIARAAV